MNWLLIGNIALMYGILVLVNIPAGLLGLEFKSNSKPRLWYQPPGFVITIVWFVLFTMLGIARFQVIDENLGSMLSTRIILLAILCASYAYYTLGLSRVTGISPLWFGLWGNILIIIFASITFIKLFYSLQSASLLILPLVLWTIYATWIVIGEMRVAKLL